MKRENDSPGVTVPGFAFWLEAKKCNMRSVRLLLDVIASHPRCSRNWRRLGKLADGVKKMQPMAAAHPNSSVRLCKATLGLGDGTKAQNSTKEAQTLKAPKHISFTNTCTYTLELPISEHWRPEVKVAKKAEVKNLQHAED